MKSIVIRNLSGNKIFILLIITNIVYVFMLTITIPNVMNFANGMKLLDMMPAGYSADYAHSLLNALGAPGRKAYLIQQLPLDFIYPGLFAITYCLLFAYILKKLDRLESFLFLLCYIPVFAGALDYCENVGIAIMLIRYPDFSKVLTDVTSMFSVLKSASTLLYFVALLVGLLILLKNISRCEEIVKMFKKAK